MSIGCVVMASGDSVRFGRPKLTASFAGKPMLAYLLDALPPTLEMVVVTRSEAVRSLAEERGYACVLHALPDLSDTIRLGMQRLRHADGCLFCVGDQPLLTRATIERIVEEFERHPSEIVRAAFGERVGNPVLFPRTLFGELAALKPGESGGTVIRRHSALARTVRAGIAEELTDVDTQEVFEALQAFEPNRMGE